MFASSSPSQLNVYKASAGAGKTFTLAAVYIAHLLNDFSEGDHPHRHLLAITFTKKATAEMKERILQYLYALAHFPESEQGFLAKVKENLHTPLSDTEIQRRAGRVLQQILHNYDRFGVNTIDSFFQALLTNLAHELHLTASFKVDINDVEVISKAVDHFLRNLQPQSEVLSWVTQYIETLLDDDKKWNISYELKELSRQLLSEPYLLKGKQLREAMKKNNLVKTYRNNLNTLKAKAIAKVEEKAKVVERLIESVGGYAAISRGTSTLRPWVNKLADIANADLSKIYPSTTILKYIDHPDTLIKQGKHKEKVLPPWTNDLATHLADLHEALLQSLSTITSCQLSTAKLNPLRLLHEIDSIMRQLNSENNVFMLAHTPLLFKEMVGEDDVSFVFERAGTTYRHIMVDEFQDTSPLQWGNLRQLFVENLAQGNSCMLVGDVKQGIYRFRKGDWNALAQMKEDATTSIHQLDSNFRSGRTIVGFNNRFFQAAASTMEQANLHREALKHTTPPALDNDVPITTLYNEENVKQNAVHEGGFVRIALHTPPSDESRGPKATAPADEAEHLDVEAELFAQMRRIHATGVAYEQMAILVRNNKESKKIMRYREEHEAELADIHLVSDEAFLLAASPAIQTIIHALRYLHNRNDIAQAYLTKNDTPAVAEQRIAQLNQWHRDNQLNDVPFYSLVQRIIALFRLDDRPDQTPYIYAFLDHVLQYLDEHPARIELFLSHWDEVLSNKSIPSSSVKGVQILTIHKSKGLAFHTLFLPYCNWKFEANAGKSLLWATPHVAPYNALPLLPIPHKQETMASIYADISYREMLDIDIENLNLLYVAFTRAEQNLLVWAEYKHRTKEMESAIINTGQLLYRTLLDANKQFNAALAGDDIATLRLETDEVTTTIEMGHPGLRPSQEGNAQTPTASPFNPLKIRHTTTETLHFELYPSRVQFRQSRSARRYNEELMGNDAATTAASDTPDLAREQGILLHSLMEQIGHQGEVDKVIAQAAAEGRIPHQFDRDDLRRLLHRAMDNPMVQPWFDGSWTLYRESKILTRNPDKEGRTYRRPDRVMMRGDETIIVDYKFGQPHSDYEGQVREYAQLLRQMGRTRLRGYLWYVAHNEVQEVDLQP